MRGNDLQQAEMWSYVSPEERVPHDHPLRPLRAMTDEALQQLQSRFNKLYAKTGRPSIAPEKLLRALLLQALHSVRSERMLMEQLNYKVLFRWFVGLNMDDPIWDVTVFTKNRERLLDGDIAEAFFQAVLQQARERNLLSDELDKALSDQEIEMVLSIRNPTLDPIRSDRRYAGMMRRLGLLQ